MRKKDKQTNLELIVTASSRNDMSSFRFTFPLAALPVPGFLSFLLLYTSLRLIHFFEQSEPKPDKIEFLIYKMCVLIVPV